MTLSATVCQATATSTTLPPLPACLLYPARELRRRIVSCLYLTAHKVSSSCLHTLEEPAYLISEMSRLLIEMCRARVRGP